MIAILSMCVAGIISLGLSHLEFKRRKTISGLCLLGAALLIFGLTYWMFTDVFTFTFTFTPN